MDYATRLRYELAARLAALTPPDDDPFLTDLYTLLALDRGEKVDREAVHNAWWVWRSRTRPGHQDLRPFDELAPDVQALDQPYVDIIRQAVRAAQHAPATR